VTLVEEPLAAPARRRPRLGSVWAAPVWAHLAALGMVLLCLLGVIGTSPSFSADEGAAVIQARSLSEGKGWLVAHPLPAADPTGVNYPLELSERGPRGWAPYGKHPLYALLLAGADRVGGLTAMVLLSLAGTVAAAGLAGALARRLDPALVRPAIWVVGLASPLCFDGFVLIAHPLGAALAAAAVLAAVVAIERRRPVTALAVVPAVATAVLLRNEAVFVALALGAVAAVVGLRRREARPAAAAVAVASIVAGAGAHLLDGWWTARLLGGPGASTGAAGAPDASGLIAGRVQGFQVTWLTPSYGGHPRAALALLVMLAAVAVGALTVRRTPGHGRRIVGCAAVAALAAVSATLAAPANVVPGVLLAFPLVAAGLLLVGRATMRSATARAMAAVSALFVLAVLATQYAKGGSGEWGGRYFALAIPVAVPVLLLALWDQRFRLDGRVARRAAGALVVCSLALTTMGVGALRNSHRSGDRLVAAVDRAGATVAAHDPVMVTTEGSMPRFAWSTFDRQRWLLASSDGLGDLLGRLRSAGVTRVGFVSRDLDRDQAPLDAAGVRVVARDDSQSARRWHVLVLDIA
jgi:hypothetical protein